MDLEQIKNKPHVILINKSDLPQKIDSTKIENNYTKSLY